MGRWAALRRNGGIGGIVQTILVYGLFGLIALAMAAQDGMLAPLAGYVAGVVVATLLRRPIVDHPEVSVPGLRVVLWGLAAVSLVGGYAWDLVEDPPSWAEPALATGLCFAATTYVTGYVWLYSDPSIVRTMD